MLPFFQEQWNNFILTTHSLWVLSQKEIRVFLDADAATKKGKKVYEIATTLEKPAIQMFDYSFLNEIPIAPFSNNTRVNNLLQHQVSSLVISCYEWLKDDLIEKGKWNMATLPKEIILLKYLRDACAHNNIFTFKDKRFLPLVWENKTLHEKLDGTHLFCVWMSYADVFYLLNDVSEAFKKLVAE